MKRSNYRKDIYDELINLRIDNIKHAVNAAGGRIYVLSTLEESKDNYFTYRPRKQWKMKIFLKAFLITLSVIVCLLAYFWIFGVK